MSFRLKRAGFVWNIWFSVVSLFSLFSLVLLFYFIYFIKFPINYYFFWFNFVTNLEPASLSSPSKWKAVSRTCVSHNHVWGAFPFKINAETKKSSTKCYISAIYSHLTTRSYHIRLVHSAQKIGDGQVLLMWWPLVKKMKFYFIIIIIITIIVIIISI